MKTFTLLITISDDDVTRSEIAKSLGVLCGFNVSAIDVVEGDHLAIDYCNSDDSYRQIKRVHRDLRLA